MCKGVPNELIRSFSNFMSPTTRTDFTKTYFTEFACIFLDGCNVGVTGSNGARRVSNINQGCVSLKGLEIGNQVHLQYLFCR